MCRHCRKGRQWAQMNSPPSGTGLWKAITKGQYKPDSAVGITEHIVDKVSTMEPALSNSFNSGDHNCLYRRLGEAFPVDHLYRPNHISHFDSLDDLAKDAISRRGVIVPIR